MKPITCIITDDEPMARKGLQGYVGQFSFLQLAGVCEDALQLQALLKKQPVELIFLDIEMPYLSGIELLQTLEHPPKVVFTTAYEQYAIQGFELDVLDYLLKPISLERFSKAVYKAKDYFETIQASKPESVFIKVNGRLEKLSFDEIYFVEAMENYVCVHTAKRKLVTHATLKSMQQLLPHFIQPHKSYLVNPSCVTAIEATQLLCNSIAIPISKYQKGAVSDAMKNYSMPKKR